MASAEREPITGLGQSPSVMQEQSPGQRVRETKPSKAESVLAFRSANEAQICPFLLSCKLLKCHMLLKEHCRISVI